MKQVSKSVTSNMFPVKLLGFSDCGRIILLLWQFLKKKIATLCKCTCKNTSQARKSYESYDFHQQILAKFLREVQTTLKTQVFSDIMTIQKFSYIKLNCNSSTWCSPSLLQKNNPKYTTSITGVSHLIWGTVEYIFKSTLELVSLSPFQSAETNRHSTIYPS